LLTKEKEMSLQTIFMPYDVYERHAVVGHLLREAIDDAMPKVAVLDMVDGSNC